ncbi:Hypothetical predicted protein [Paramuricea clavata]|uniref:Uncharacterized protein n=1 Tax=Paramuricea clavata TaxID=317549 RepID=A0A6S7IU45_PARCT|nr:Hypothetical predicted protein [Paramuricea clavata]
MGREPERSAEHLKAENPVIDKVDKSSRIYTCSLDKLQAYNERFIRHSEFSGNFDNSTKVHDSLKRINHDSHDIDDEIHAGIVYAGKLGGDPEAEFNCKHRMRRPPRRIDDNPTQSQLSDANNDAVLLE